MFLINVSVTLYMRESVNNLQLIFFFSTRKCNFVVIYLNRLYKYYI